MSAPMEFDKHENESPISQLTRLEINFDLMIQTMDMLMLLGQEHDGAEHLFRPHLNLLAKHVNRLIRLRPMIYRDVKNVMVKRLQLPDLEPDYLPIDPIMNPYRIESLIRKANMYENYFKKNMVTGSAGDLYYNYQVPYMIASELRHRKVTGGNRAPGTYSYLLKDFHPMPSEQKNEELTLVNPKHNQRINRNPSYAYGSNDPLIHYDERFNMQLTPDDMGVIYEPQIYGWNLDELKERTKRYVAWMTGGVTGVLNMNPSPTAEEWANQAVTPFDNFVYYDAWTDIYRYAARTKRKKLHKRPEERVPLHTTYARETMFDRKSGTDVIGLVKRVNKLYRFQYDSYSIRTGHLDWEVGNRRMIFYEKLDRFLRFFSYYLRKRWAKEFLKPSRWQTIKTFLKGQQIPDSFYEDYILSHGWHHFLTNDDKYARYMNDIFFRFFIDAPKFDRRPMALLDRHRYDKDQQDIYFDPLYDSRTLNNPYPLHLEHANWSLKPWYDFVNAQFALYRYQIASNGERPSEFPQMKEEDVLEYERMVLPDIQHGYDAIYTWGRDLLDPVYKKQKRYDTTKSWDYFVFGEFLDPNEDYLEDLPDLPNNN